MTVTIFAQDNEFAASSGDNVNVTSSYSYFDHPPDSTRDLTITSNMGDDRPFLFEVGETYDLIWDGRGGGGDMNDATVVRSDYLSPGKGAIVFEGTNSVTGEEFQMVWTPGFDLEEWYWANGGGPSRPLGFWTSDQNASDSVQVVCYALGTKVRTDKGDVAVEGLKIDDFVVTADNGLQRIRWVHTHDQPLETDETETKPVLISANALGNGRPQQDLVVSAQHRVLVGGDGQLGDLFPTEVFVPAKSLTMLPGIRHMKGKRRISWVHFACDRHEVVFANGCSSESLLLGPMVMNRIKGKARRFLDDIFGTAKANDMALTAQRHARA